MSELKGPEQRTQRRETYRRQEVEALEPLDLRDEIEGLCECGGSGWIVTCVDDLCRNGGRCIHGVGEEECPCQF